MGNCLAKLATIFQPVVTAAVVALAVCGLAGPVMVVADARSSESQQSAPFDERPEEATASSRVDQHRQIKLDHRRPEIIFEVPASTHLGHTQNSVLFAPGGHRLANCLLAPRTC